MARFFNRIQLVEINLFQITELTVGEILISKPNQSTQIENQNSKKF